MHLYLHVPFCARRCVYCDFAIAVRRTVPVDDYLDGLARELVLRGIGPVVLDTLYLGGGTPSRLGASGIARTLDLVRRHATLAAGAEVTMEANPEDVTAEAVRRWIDAGVNRLSLGVQSFDDAVLAWMHRTHRHADVVRAVEVARAAGLSALSLDLIFAMPERVPRDWARDLDAMVAIAPPHVSVYGLTVEAATPLGRWAARGDVVESPEERWAAEFTLAHDRLTAAGYAHYEVSNYAQPGGRAQHNSAYWSDRAYLGVGPAAHGFDGTVRRSNIAAYAEWLAALRAGRDPVATSERLGAESRAAERVYLGLRTQDGLVLAAGERAIVEPWVKAGWARIEDWHDSSERVVLTVEGWMRLDALAASLTSAGSC
jgi:oxygen-independent coproporphyrinogen III oxidase